MNTIFSNIRTLAAALLFTIAGSALAGNSSTGGVPSRPIDWNQEVKFLITHNAGFSPHPMNTVITISGNGRVTSVTTNLDGSVVSRRSVAVLATSVIARMADLGRQLDGQMIDENAGEPMCTDAPSMSYSFVESRANGGQQTAFFRRSGCHDFSDQSGAAYQLRQVLDGLDQISNLAE